MKKREEEESCDRRCYDSMTGLLTRRAFFEEAAAYMQEARGASAGVMLCMLAIDVEHFRYYNRWFGRNAGDRLLGAIGGSLQELDCMEHTLSAYFGGDNYYILFAYSDERLNRIRESVISVINGFTGSTEFRPLFGAYLVKEELHWADVCDRAASACAEASDNLSTDTCWFDEKLAASLEEEVRLIPQVRRGLENREFTFYLQPKCQLQSGKVVGAEALVRWLSPEHGLIPAGQFIPVLEKNGFLVQLDQFLWEEVCKKLREWLDRGIRPLPVSVNVSRADIYAVNVSEYFSSLVKKYNVPTEYIEIEITESAYVENEKIIKEAEEALRAEGFTVLIDDFGSGYSSLNMLKEIQADVLKLDLRFLQMDTKNEEKGMEIISSVLGMAKQLDMEVVAEGVETKEQAELLNMLGCEFVQGFYFYKPMPVADYENIVSKAENIVYSKTDNRKKRHDVSYMKATADYFLRLTEINLDTGEYQCIKSMTRDAALNTPYQPQIEGFFARVVEAGLVCEEDLPYYTENVKLTRVKALLAEHDGRLSYCYRTKIDGQYVWVDLEITAPSNYSADNPWVLFSWKRAGEDAVAYWKERLKNK